MLFYAKEHLAAAFQNSMNTRVGVKTRPVRTTKLSEVFQDFLARRRPHGQLVSPLAAVKE